MNMPMIMFIKRSFLYVSIFVFGLLALVSCVGGQNKADADNSERILSQRVDSLLQLMTLEEKLGQMIIYPTKGNVTGPSGSVDNIEELIKEGKCGNLFGALDAKEAHRLQKLAMEHTRLKIPLLLGCDVIHGYKTIFPVNLGISASWDLNEIERFARISAEEASSAGLHWTFSPMCDISRDPRWGRVSEGSGEDPYLGGLIAAAMVRGYQGDDLSKDNTILSCAKHFIAYGAAQAGRDYHTVDISERELRDTYLPPFKAAIDAGAATVMSAFNEYDGVPCTANSFLMRDILREELGFKGFVVADYTAVKELIAHGVADSDKEAACLGMNAGVNMCMVDNLYLFHGEKLVKEGAVSEENVNELCSQILRMKFKLGLFDNPYRYGSEEKEENTLFNVENLHAAKEMAKKSMVLLQNKGNTLPVKAGKKIALIGPFADNKREMLGSWVLAPEPKRTVSFREGMEKRYGKEYVNFAPGCRIHEEIPNGFRDAIAQAQKSDVIFYTMGLSIKESGEAASMTSLRLPDVQMQLLDRLKATGKPVIVLLVVARPIELKEVAEKVSSLLLTWNPGTMAGTALAEVVSGDYNPSGKLTMTFPLATGQVPIHYDMKNTGRPQGLQSVSSEKYKSRYIDCPNEPLYPFGYGLSYTNFEYSDIQPSSVVAEEGDELQFTVTVKNTGYVDGEEVVQLYIRDMKGSVTRPVKELKGFNKILIKAGETRKITFNITPEDLSFTRKNMTWGAEKGEYKLWIGGDSDAKLEASFTIK